MTSTSFHMIDISQKRPCRRLAVASGQIVVGQKAFTLIQSQGLPKGDALALAKIAGIQAAKKTAEWIPLCHPLPLEHVELVCDLDPEHHAVVVTSFVSTTAKTGVEMEALAAVQAALLTIYDVTKMVEPHLVISTVRLLCKIGGKQGRWLSPDGVPGWILNKIDQTTQTLTGIKSAVLCVSDRASQGQYQDQSGLWLKNALQTAGSEVVDYKVLPDEQVGIVAYLRTLLAQRPHVIITTGGTGISPRDVTPEAILALSPQIIPGIGECLRFHGSQFTACSWLSRSLAAVVEGTLIIALPGRLKAVQESFDAFVPLLPHLMAMLTGGNHEGTGM